MDSVMVPDPAPVERLGFFERQFALEQSRQQDFFDGLFGVFLPVLCFLADPVVFKGGIIGPNDSLLGDYQLLAYSFSAFQIATLLTWRTFRRQLASFSAPIAGVLLAGALCSFLIGLLILPYS